MAKWRTHERGRWSVSLLIALAGLAVGAHSPGDALASGHSEVLSPALERLAATHPGSETTVIVQFRRSVDRSTGRHLLQATGARIVADLPIVNGVAARMTAVAARSLRHRDLVPPYR